MKRLAPGRTVALGFAALVAVPVLALLLLLSVVGIPLALALLAAYLLMLLGGFLSGLLYPGDLGVARLAPARAQSSAAIIAALLAALAALWLVRLVPVVGGLATFLLPLFGTGALLLGLYRRYRGPQPPGAAASWPRFSIS